MAQALPVLLGGIFWRGATKTGAVAGLVTGFAVWAYTLFLPSFGQGAVIPAHVFAGGAFGLPWLRPQGLFGTQGMDPLVHSIFWSLVLNTAAFCAGSIFSFPDPVERVQGAAFVNAFDGEVQAERLGWSQGQAEPEALLILAQRILGEEALSFFEAGARAQGKDGYLPDITPAFLADLERRLAGSVGAATAHAMISQLFGQATVTVEDLMAVATEAAQIMEYSTRLEQNQEELTRTARQLREANEKLTQLSVQKDAFLGQISHELRTPMTSIRAFSEILSEGDLPPQMVADYGHILHDEAVRLTRLLDDLLDLSVLENGTVQLNLGLSHLGRMLDRAEAAASQTRPERAFRIEREGVEEIFLHTDADRLVQVFINLISNARKYCDAEAAVLKIRLRQKGGRVIADFIDNGSGIAKEAQGLIFEKFARLTDQRRAGGAGLGLAICREIMANLGGSIGYLPGQKGAAFRVTLPLRLEAAKG
jgi:signal transduction histidine kinase